MLVKVAQALSTQSRATPPKPTPSGPYAACGTMARVLAPRCNSSIAAPKSKEGGNSGDPNRPCGSHAAPMRLSSHVGSAVGERCCAAALLWSVMVPKLLTILATSSRRARSSASMGARGGNSLGRCARSARHRSSRTRVSTTRQAVHTAAARQRGSSSATHKTSSSTSVVLAHES